jgi:hypothetical protein
MPGDSYPILTYLTYNNHPFSDLTVRLRSQHDLSRYLSVYSDIPCFHHSSLNPHFCWRNPIFQWINHDKSQLFILKSQEFQSQQSWSTLCMYYIYISYIYIPYWGMYLQPLPAAKSRPSWVAHTHWTSPHSFWRSSAWRNSESENSSTGAFVGCWKSEVDNSQYGYQIGNLTVI